MEKEQKFYLGLDIGTNSVGIACTDENYNLLRVKGKDCWAVRLFDEAQTAADRRTARTARRRLQRRRYRINQLQGLFAPFMQDNLFFLRLTVSFLPTTRQANWTATSTTCLPTAVLPTGIFTKSTRQFTICVLLCSSHRSTTSGCTTLRFTT